MQQAVVEAPHFYTNISIDMTEALKLRAVFKADADLKEVSVNHLILKAAGYALKKVPGVNASVKGEDHFQPDQINIGIVTAVDGGLMIPVVRSVDSLHLKDLAFEARAAIDRARAGRPSGTDLSGGTFSISNMGMFGVESFTAIINPGQGAILAVGGTIEQPVVKNGVVQSAPIMKVTLSVDHRIIDGTMSGNWLTHFKQALEQPAVLLL
jgi:pyruvate dehydrogenase E2 component (dihydrolipoamide acetyltransferase)